jgi:multiple sugar transport system permease protein
MTTTAVPSNVPGAARQPTARPQPRTRTKLVFLLPAALFLAAFALYPLIQLLRMSVSAVSSATLNHHWSFTALDNIVRGWQSGQLTAAFARTAVFVVVVTVLGLAGGLAAAIALRSSGRTTGVLLGLMMFVWALPPVVNGSVWKFLLGDTGIVNGAIRWLGLAAKPLPFLYDQYWALASVAFVNSWAVIPFNALVFRAALMNIPEEVFEAAQLDGARPSQVTRRIIIPAVQPTTLVLTVLTVVYAFRSFDFIYVMTYGGPGDATNTLPFLAYLQAFVRFDYGLGSATAVVTVLLVLVMAVVYARGIRREETAS